MAGPFESFEKPQALNMESVVRQVSPEPPLGKYMGALQEPQFYLFKNKEEVIAAMRKEAEFEKLVTEGVNYNQARQQAGLKPDMDPGFSGGEESITRGIIQQGRYERYLREGMNYQDARQKAGFGPDIDPGIEIGGARAIEDSHRYQSWLKEQLREGASFADADKRAKQEVAKARKSLNLGADK